LKSFVTKRICCEFFTWQQVSQYTTVHTNIGQWIRVSTMAINTVVQRTEWATIDGLVADDAVVLISVVVVLGDCTVVVVVDVLGDCTVVVVVVVLGDCTVVVVVVVLGDCTVVVVVA
jgi:hypothetical protein